MRRLFILSLLAMMIALGIGGCGGGGEGTSADPLGTDGMMFGHKNDAAGTDWSMAMQTTPMGTVALTAKVKNASGNPVAGREVTFRFVANQSGATLNTSPGPVKANTDNAGEATITYTAGTTTPGFDIVRASLSNGATMDTNITVASTGTGELKIALDGSLTSLSAGQNSILTATVTDGLGNPISGAIVHFSWIWNRSAANLDDLHSGLGAPTDADGKAVAVYTAGWATPTQIVEDTIQASVAGATGAIVMTRTAGGGGVPTYAVSIGASATSVTAGQVSIITATLTGDNNVGVTVTFSLPVNISGASLSASSAVTDSNGNAVVIYQPGTTSPTLTVQDTVQAAAGTTTSAVAITRTGSSTSAFSIIVNALPATLTTNASNSVVTANVTNNLGTVVSGVTVNFAVTGVFPLGTLSVASAITDGNGNAVTTFTGNGTGLTGATSVVTASVTVSGNTYTNAVVITYP
jgi:hypothetical protein